MVIKCVNLGLIRSLLPHPPSIFVSKGWLVRMQSLWLISILLLTTFSEGKRERRQAKTRFLGRQKRPRLTLYSRIKKDLDGVEKRIQGELREIVDTVTELKDITEDALIEPSEIAEVETIDDNYDEEKGGVIAGNCKF